MRQEEERRLSASFCEKVWKFLCWHWKARCRWTVNWFRLHFLLIINTPLIDLSLLLPLPPDKELHRIESYRPCDRTIADEEMIMVRVHLWWHIFDASWHHIVSHRGLLFNHFDFSATWGANATYLCIYWILLCFGYAKAKKSIGKFVWPKKKNRWQYLLAKDWYFKLYGYCQCLKREGGRETGSFFRKYRIGVTD